ncbi:CO dehydrogenase/acetyl-CoA synthase complex subunit epsilon [Methanobacterium ferruginis]|jgi:acetyl-CoA decarbonylase/synthase complex subunit epsilon|uniref:CO dehydrogenase/acetyl-CoA synthase complex subunit epsilon n=1 Tax=Methanobacterium ferruginis TaxID=710191 RepID=UPI00257366B2|nr:CO dehydrogenase/acetyl-CoA synthase complex subunit epsilon [Methanobacterium ferruginis]MCC7550901.1 CO dehydrogenase/acetyl-CoA synthase complex subunit epsilon [Methanobacterium sp.]BDZ66654.1 acetyl-CoA synthase subunit epsilon [Methanobacterium ferruginis]
MANERVIPWQPTVIAGPKQALLVTPETAELMIKKAKRPLFILGPLVKEDPLLTYATKIAEKWNLQVVTTADAYKPFNDKGLNPTAYGVVEIVNLLKDPEWQGVDGEGQHDLVIFMGCIYYIASQGLSSLKHYAPHLKTLTICKFFHSNADASFPNLKDEEWFKYLEKMGEVG